MATSEAKHLAGPPEMKLRAGLAAGGRGPPLCTPISLGGPRPFIAMSASSNWTGPGNSISTCRIACGSLVYATAMSKAPWATPTACAPTVGRVWVEGLQCGFLGPVPGSPMIRSPGDVAVLENTARWWVTPLIPIFRSLGADAESFVVLVHHER